MLVTALKAAKHFNFNRIYLQQLANKGKLPAVKVGRQWMFDLEQMEKFFKDETTKKLLK